MLYVREYSKKSTWTFDNFAPSPQQTSVKKSLSLAKNAVWLSSFWSLWADCRTIDERRLSTENCDGWIEQCEQEPDDDQRQTDAASVALAEHWAQPTDRVTQQPRLGGCRTRVLLDPLLNKRNGASVVFVVHRNYNAAEDENEIKAKTTAITTVQKKLATGRGNGAERRGKELGKRESIALPHF